MPISPAIRKYLKENATNGGKKRWRGKTKAQKSDHMRAMALARWKRNGT